MIYIENFDDAYKFENRDELIEWVVNQFPDLRSVKVRSIKKALEILNEKDGSFHKFKRCSADVFIKIKEGIYD